MLQPVTQVMSLRSDAHGYARADEDSPAHGTLGSADQVRRLVEEDFLRGARRRRFAYEPPEGWLGAAEGSAVRWSAGDPVDQVASITVWPAAPKDEDAAAVVEQLLGERRGWYELHGPVNLRSREGLHGAMWQLTVIGADGTRRCFDLVVLQDERYLYPVRLESTESRHVRDLADLFDLVHSIQPLARP